jgi:hypothetical protein
LAHFFQEYRLYRRDPAGQVVKQNDLLMNCLRSMCVSGLHRMSTEPAPPETHCWSAILPSTPGAWMAEENDCSTLSIAWLCDRAHQSEY